MAKLMVRGYRPTSSAEGTGFALVNATSDIAVVQEWIVSTPEGLLLHTGFEHLKGDVIRRLIVEARGQLVVCAASRILIGDTLPGKAWEMISGNEAHHIQLRSMGEWFFVATDASGQDDTFISSASVSADLGLVPEANTERCVATPSDNYGSEKLMELIRRHPDVSHLIKEAGILNDADFLSREHDFSIKYRLEFAEISFAIASEEASAMYEKAKALIDIASAALKLAQATPAWMMNTLPLINTRLKSAFLHGNIECLGTLVRISAEELAELPFIGRKSIGELFHYLHNELMPLARAVLMERYGPETSLDSFAFNEAHSDVSAKKSLAQALEEACVAAERIDKRQGFVLRERVKGRVLEDIALELEVTRERIRQISVKALAHFTQGVRTPCVAALELFFDGLYADEYATSESCEALFRAVGIHSVHNRAVLKIIESMLKLTKYHLGVVTVSGIERTLPFPNILRGITDTGFDSLIDQVALSIYTCTKDEARLIACGAFSKAGLPPFLAALFARDVVEARVFQSPDGSVTGQPISASLRHQKILEFFRSRDTAVNWHGEGLPYIQQKFPHPDGAVRYADNDVADIRKNTLSSSDDYLFPLGYGDYGMWKHVPLNDDEALLIARTLSTYLAEHSNRQFTDKDLLNVLSARGIASFSQADRRSKHYISAALFRTRLENIRYLGRFTWCSGSWTDEPDTENRLFINDILSEAIRDKGRPMWQKELRDAVIAVRGHGTEFFQIIEKDGIVKLATSLDGNLYWDTGLDPYPIKSEEAQQIQGEISEQLQKAFQMSVRTLKASLSRTSDWVASYNDAEFFALALRVPGVAMTTTKSGLSLRYSSSSSSATEASV